MVAVTGTDGLQAAEGTHGRAGAAGARADAGGVRLTGRDIAGLVWCGEMYGIRADLLGSLLGVSPDVVRQLHAQWRRAGLAETGRLGPGPVWCWLTRLGLEACGLPYAASQPPLGKVAACARGGCCAAGAGLAATAVTVREPGAGGGTRSECGCATSH
jgi:hypothetical protein